MERFRHEFDPLGEDEQLLADKSKPAIPEVVISRIAMRNLRIVHLCWLLCTAVAAIIVYLAFLNPSTARALAQTPAAVVATEVRMVHAEDKLDNLGLIVNNNSADIKVLNEKISTLSGEVTTLSSRLQGAYLLVQVGGAVLLLLGAIGAFFTRKAK